MLKVRYFQIELPVDLAALAQRLDKVRYGNAIHRVRVIKREKDEVVLSYAVSRVIPIRKVLEDGSTTIESASTMDLHSIRIFRSQSRSYLAIIDPPRGSRVVSDFLNDVFENGDCFIAPLEILPPLIELHVGSFDTARLVSAKIRDFEVYEGAVGRLEVTSQAGLRPSIAPFLENKYHKIDALTYEVTHNLAQGLVYYQRNGTVKVTTPLVEFAFPLFEQCLE